MQRFFSKQVSSKQRLTAGPARVLTALLLCVLMMGLSFAGTTAAVIVTNLTEYETAINDSYKTSDAVTITFATTLIDLGTASIPVPSNVTVNLNGGTLRSSGVLSVSGSVVGGTVEIVGGTLLRKSGSNITAAISVSSGGQVRGPMTLSLENEGTVSAGYMTSVSYEGESGSDSSSYINGHFSSEVIYTQMTGSNYSQYKIIDKVTTNSGYVFRLGTRNTSTLSLVYSINYDGLTGAKLAAVNPTSYTESDSAFTLTNPTKDGYTFVGWVCASLGIVVPDDSLTVAEGTSGDLTFIATWVEGTLQSGKSGAGTGGGGTASTTTDSDTDTTEDAETAQAAAAAADSATTSTKRVKQASSSTKTTFTSEVATVLPTVESVKGEAFPWGWLFGGVAGAAVLAYVAALIARKIHEK